MKSLNGKLSDFWPAGGPRWDALGTVTLPDGRKGVLLVEAKSHVDEIESGGMAAVSKTSEAKIRKALDETRQVLGLSPGAAWLGSHYQSANRLAHLHFLRNRATVPAWLVNVLFVGDPAPARRTTREEWAAKMAEVRRALGWPKTDVSGVADVILDSVDEPWAL